MSKRKKSSQKILPDSSELNFCPLCQIPLHFLKITGDMHLLRCEKNSWDQSKECQDGIDCFSSDFHHYWDFTHATLAQHRSLNLNTSKNSEEAGDEVKGSQTKKMKDSPKKKIKRNSKKQTTPKSKRKHNVLSPSDSSDDDFLPKSGTKNSSKLSDQTNLKDECLTKRPKVTKARNKHRVLSDNSEDESSNDSGVLFLNIQSPSTKSKSNPAFTQQSSRTKEDGVSNENNLGKEGFIHFLYSNSQEMFSNYQTNDIEPKSNYSVEDTTSNEKQFQLGQVHAQAADIEMFKQESTPTKYTTCEFKTEETDISPKKFSSQGYDDQFPTPTKYLTQEFKEVDDASPKDYFKFHLKNESESSALEISHPEIAQVPQIQFSDSSDDDCEVNSETGEILYTEKFEHDENSQGSKEKPLQVQDEPILVMEDIKKVSKQVQSIEAWKKILNNKQQSIDKSKSSNTKSSSSYTNEPTEARYTSTDRAPFYKLIPDTDFVVDGFKNGPVVNKNNYFLSHFHYDHYIGLNKHFTKTIHCSKITSELLKSIIKIDAKYIRIIDVDETKVINHVEVTALDANHCPGALMFVFKTLQGHSYLHTGDFRADISMQNEDILKNTYFEKVYLDTTYCNPQYNFPSQTVVLKKLLKLVEENHQKYPNTLYICGSYTIGKEKVYISILKKMKWKIYVESYKRKILNILNNETINSCIVDNAFQAKLHVIAMSKLNNIHHLMTYYESYKTRYDKVVAIKPTGWTYSERNENNIHVKKIDDNISVFEISYSEHSSFLELCSFVKFLRYKQIVCTVNVKNSEKQVQLIDSYIKNKMNSANQVTNTLNLYFKREGH